MSASNDSLETLNLVTQERLLLGLLTRLGEFPTSAAIRYTRLIDLGVICVEPFLRSSDEKITLLKLADAEKLNILRRNDPDLRLLDEADIWDGLLAGEENDYRTDLLGAHAGAYVTEVNGGFSLSTTGLNVLTGLRRIFNRKTPLETLTEIAKDHLNHQYVAVSHADTLQKLVLFRYFYFDEERNVFERTPRGSEANSKIPKGNPKTTALKLTLEEKIFLVLRRRYNNLPISAPWRWERLNAHGIITLKGSICKGYKAAFGTFGARGSLSELIGEDDYVLLTEGTSNWDALIAYQNGVASPVIAGSKYAKAAAEVELSALGEETLKTLEQTFGARCPQEALSEKEKKVLLRNDPETYREEIDDIHRLLLFNYVYMKNDRLTLTAKGRNLREDLMTGKSLAKETAKTGGSESVSLYQEPSYSLPGSTESEDQVQSIQDEELTVESRKEPTLFVRLHVIGLHRIPGGYWSIAHPGNPLPEKTQILLRLKDELKDVTVVESKQMTAHVDLTPVSTTLLKELDEEKTPGEKSSLPS